VGLDPAAIGLWTMGLAYCGNQLTDGALPRAAVLRLLAEPPETVLRLADKLVTAGLWEIRGDGFVVHDYLDWNDRAAEVKARRISKREKQKRWRDRQSGRYVSGYVDRLRDGLRDSSRDRLRDELRDPAHTDTDTINNPPGPSRGNGASHRAK